MTPPSTSPLQALADAALSKKEIERLLQGIADREVERFVAFPSAYNMRGGNIQAHIYLKLEAFINSRWFSAFGRKKTFDRVIKRALKNRTYAYFTRMDFRRRQLERIRAENEDRRAAEWVPPRKRARVKVKKRSKGQKNKRS